MNKKTRSSLVVKRLRRIFWIIVIMIAVLTFYVNWYMPHGEYYPTGYSRYDEVGPEYLEDMRELNIPNWAKFLRVNGFRLFFMLAIIGVVLESKSRQE